MRPVVTTQPQEFPKCCHCAMELIWMNGTSLKSKLSDSHKTSAHLCTNLYQTATEGSGVAILSTGRWQRIPSSDPLHKSPAHPSLLVANPSWWGPGGLWGAPGAAQLEEKQSQRLKGNLGRASQLPAAGEGQRCHSAAPERAQSHQRAAPISPGSECFLFLLPLMNLIWHFMLIKPDLKQLYLESRFHCRHSCCMTDATVLSQHCFQCLQQLHSIPLPDIKCTLILINGKKINLWGK